jgi:threonine dehydratase
MLTAIRRLALEARLVAEPGGAVAVAAALELGGDLPVVAVLSGGNISPDLLARVLAS